MNSLSAEEKHYIPDLNLNRERLENEALARLGVLGLDFQQLEKYKRVMDFGAGACFIERAAKLNGLTNITSVDKNPLPPALKGAGLNYIQAQGAELALPDESFDLILENRSGLYHSRDEMEASQILYELLRVLKTRGEIRVHPVTFGFVQKSLQDKFPKYGNAAAVLLAHRSLEEKRIMTELGLRANEMTMDFLKKLQSDFKFSASNERVKADSNLPKEQEEFLRIVKS